MNNNADIISTLNELVEYCKDGEKGYATVAEDVKKESWKPLFQSYSKQRADFALELEQHVKTLGEMPEDHGSITGALHRTWIDIKSVISSGEEKAILGECETGDSAAVKKYEEALETSLPPATKKIVTDQYLAIKTAYQNIVRLHEEIKESSSL